MVGFMDLVQSQKKSFNPLWWSVLMRAMKTEEDAEQFLNIQSKARSDAFAVMEFYEYKGLPPMKIVSGGVA